MKPGQIQFWQKTISTTAKWMEPKHRLWRRLLRAYRMDFPIESMPSDEIVKISRFYPLTRQIIASIAFNYPRIFMRVDEPGRRLQAEILSRAINDAIQVTNVRPHVHQAIFDALYCYRGFLKFDYNPPGDNDIIAPYVASDALQNDMPCVRRISPFNIFLDPLAPPHMMSDSRFIIEKMVVPLEFVKQDERFVNRSQVRPVSDEITQDEVLQNIQEDDERFGEEHESDAREAIEEAKKDGKYTVLYEIHDRIHGKRITFAHGVEQPIEDIDHPFLEMEPITIPDPATGQELMTGEFEPTGAFLCEGGFPYHSLSFDMNDESLYGEPMMAYVEDEQNGVVESVSRRMDLLKRYSRVMLGQKGEQEENRDIQDRLAEGRDGTVIWVNDVHNSFSEMPSGNPPQDQLGIERDLRAYEDQVLNVSQMAMAQGGRKTATEASLIASFGQLNREWLQFQVSEVYRVIAHNYSRIMADQRYTPENFLVNVAESEQDPVFEAVTSDLFKTSFKVSVEAASMRPLFEELEKEDTLALYNYLKGNPMVDQMEALRYVLRAFRVPDPEKLIGQAQDAEAIRAAQLENQFMSGRLQDPGVVPQQDHQVHLQQHQQWQNDPAITQMIQQHMQMNPQALQQFQMVLQGHVQQHQQMLQQLAQGQTPTAKARPSLRDMGGGSDPRQMAQGIQSTVRSNAQRVAQSVSLNSEQN